MNKSWLLTILSFLEASRSLVRSDQIRSGQVSLVPTEQLGQTRGENKVIESLKVQCGGFDISWSHFRLQSLSLLKLVGLIRLLIKMR